MIQLGIIPSWQFSPDNPYNRNPHLTFPPGVTQSTIQPLDEIPIVYGTGGNSIGTSLGITMVDPPLKRFVSSLGATSSMTWGWVPTVGVVAALGTGIYFLARHFGKKRRRR